MKNLDIIDQISEDEFVENYVKTNQPVVIRNASFDASKWTPEFIRGLLGDLSVQVYDTLFSLQEVSTLNQYLDSNFGHSGDYREKVPYVRWYNKLKDVDYPWGDEAFKRMSKFWERPAFFPTRDLLIPVTSESKVVNPVTDAFPYRGILIAAKGARTRLHRDPFCSDAIVSQFYGVKEFILYGPDRSNEVMNKGKDSTSFGGFIDVRRDGIESFHPEPDYHGLVGAGAAIYVPHGWLHDALVTEDSVSITWNFIHEKGALEFIDYLMNGPEADSEFEVLKYFYALGGEQVHSAKDILRKFSRRFSEIEAELT